MLRGFHCAVLVVALLLAVCGPVSAQTTGQIRGQVVDQDGGALPGVTLTLTGELIPSREITTITGATGNFAYAGLAIGKYTLTAALASFGPQAKEVTVQLDGTTTVAFRLMLGTFKEEVTVKGETPLVDVASSSSSTNYTSQQVAALPLRSNFYEVILLTPGVSSPSDGSSRMGAFGSNVTSQQWNIDGMNTSSTEEGSLYWSLNPEIVAETQVMGTGAGAQYGNMLGNVTNVVTKTGTNTFKGSVFALYTNDALTGTNVVLPNSAWPSHHTDYYGNGSLTLGGPVLQDRLWFFGAAQGARWKSNGPGVDPSLVLENKLTRYDFKVTSQITSRHRFNVQGHFGNSDNPGGPSRFTEDTGKSKSKQGGVAADYNAILTPTTFLEAHGGHWYGNDDNVSRTNSTQPNVIWVPIDGSTSTTSGRMFWETQREFKRDAADVAISHFADNFIKGSHQLKFGVQFSRGSASRLVGNTGFGWTQPCPCFGFMNAPYYYMNWFWQETPPFYYGADTQSFSVFAQDSWKISSTLTVDAGIRYDYNNGSIPDFPLLKSTPVEGATSSVQPFLAPGFPNYGTPTGQTIPGAKNLIQWHNNWAPRLGFAWQPRGDARTVIRGNAGLYIDGPVAAAWYAPPPGRGPENYYYSFPPSTAWVLGSTKLSGASGDKLLDPGVQPAKTWQYSIGVEQQLAGNWAVGAMFVYKTTKDQIGWKILYDGVYAPFVFTDPVNGNQFVLRSTLKAPTQVKGNSTGDVVEGDQNYAQQYRGLVLTFRKRYSNAWDLSGSYVLSKANGYEARPTDGGGLGQGLPNYTASAGSDPNQWLNTGGLLTGDRKHMFRVLGSYLVGYGIRVSATVNLESGRPWARLAQVTPPVGAGNAVPMEERRDSQRYPFQKIVGFGVDKQILLGRRTSLNLGLTVLNLFNTDAIQGWASVNLFAGQQLTPSFWVDPRQARLTVRLNF